MAGRRDFSSLSSRLGLRLLRCFRLPALSLTAAQVQPPDLLSKSAAFSVLLRPLRCVLLECRPRLRARLCNPCLGVPAVPSAVPVRASILFLHSACGRFLLLIFPARREPAPWAWDDQRLVHSHDDRSQGKHAAVQGHFAASAPTAACATKAQRRLRFATKH